MKRVLLALIIVTAAACGSSSPSSPSMPSAPVPTAPVYPNLVAGWSGTATIGAVGGGAAASNVCQTTWVITSQSAGSFSGSYQLSGGTTTTCGQSASVQGTVDTTGQISIAFTSNQSAVPAGCTIAGGTAMTGVVTGNAMTLQQTVRLTCNGVAIEQTASIALSRR